MCNECQDDDTTSLIAVHEFFLVHLLVRIDKCRSATYA